MSKTLLDPVARLKALRNARGIAQGLADSNTRTSRPAGHIGAKLGRAAFRRTFRKARRGSRRFLARRCRNHFGEYLALRNWFSESIGGDGCSPPRYSG